MTDNNRPDSIPVRVGSQSRVFAISRKGRMKWLDERVLNNDALARGIREIVTIDYDPSCVRAYHSHEAGKSLVPTAPKSVSGDGFIRIQRLSEADFVSHLPKIVLRNNLLRRWFPEKTLVSGYRLDDKKMTINLTQHPEIEGLDSFEIKGQLDRTLSFLNGSAVLEMTMNDFFGFGRKLRIYHDGHREARLGLQHTERFDLIRSVACDAVRQRFLYRSNRSGMQVATIYQANPGKLYSLGYPNHDGQTRLILRELAPDFILGVRPTRDLEWDVIKHGNAYDHGTIGAEIAYAIASRMLMTDKLMISEPARSGADIISRDGKFIVEARMLTRTRLLRGPSLVGEVRPHMKQMMRRIYWERSSSTYARGLAILSLQTNESIIALIKEA